MLLCGLLTLYAAGGCDLDAFCIAFTVACTVENEVAMIYDVM